MTEFGLFEKLVLKISWDLEVNASKDGKEVVLERADSPFHGILPVDMGGNKLEGAVAGPDGL